MSDGYIAYIPYYQGDRPNAEKNSLLIEVCPDMDDEHHNEEDKPSSKGTETTREFLLVEDESNSKRSDDLRQPIHEVVQRTRTDIE